MRLCWPLRTKKPRYFGGLHTESYKLGMLIKDFVCKKEPTKTIAMGLCLADLWCVHKSIQGTNNTLHMQFDDAKSQYSNLFRKPSCMVRAPTKTMCSDVCSQG